MSNLSTKAELLETQKRLQTEILRRQSQLEPQANLLIEQTDVLDFAATCATYLLICSKLIDEAADGWAGNKDEGKAISKDLTDVSRFLAEELISLRTKLIAEGHKLKKIE